MSRFFLDLFGYYEAFVLPTKLLFVRCSPLQRRVPKNAKVSLQSIEIEWERRCGAHFAGNPKHLLSIVTSDIEVAISIREH